MHPAVLLSPISPARVLHVCSAVLLCLQVTTAVVQSNLEAGWAAISVFATATPARGDAAIDTAATNVTLAPAGQLTAAITSHDGAATLTAASECGASKATQQSVKVHVVHASTGQRDSGKTCLCNAVCFGAVAQT